MQNGDFMTYTGYITNVFDETFDDRSEKYSGKGYAELSEGESDYFMDLEESDVDNGKLC